MDPNIRHTRRPTHTRKRFSSTRLSTDTSATLPEYSEAAFPVNPPGYHASNPKSQSYSSSSSDDADDEPSPSPSPPSPLRATQGSTSRGHKARGCIGSVSSLPSSDSRRRSSRRHRSSSDTKLDALLERSVHALELSNALLQSSMSTHTSLSAALAASDPPPPLRLPHTAPYTTFNHAFDTLQTPSRQLTLEESAHGLSKRISGFGRAQDAWMDEMEEVVRGVEELFTPTRAGFDQPLNRPDSPEAGLPSSFPSTSRAAHPPSRPRLHLTPTPLHPILPPRAMTQYVSIESPLPGALQTMDFGHGVVDLSNGNTKDGEYDDSTAAAIAAAKQHGRWTTVERTAHDDHEILMPSTTGLRAGPHIGTFHKPGARAPSPRPPSKSSRSSSPLVSTSPVNSVANPLPSTSAYDLLSSLLPLAPPLSRSRSQSPSTTSRGRPLVARRGYAGGVNRTNSGRISEEEYVVIDHPSPDPPSSPPRAIPVRRPPPITPIPHSSSFSSYFAPPSPPNGSTAPLDSIPTSTSSSPKQSTNKASEPLAAHTVQTITSLRRILSQASQSQLSGKTMTQPTRTVKAPPAFLFPTPATKASASTSTATASVSRLLALSSNSTSQPSLSNTPSGSSAPTSPHLNPTVPLPRQSSLKHSPSSPSSGTSTPSRSVSGRSTPRAKVSFAKEPPRYSLEREREGGGSAGTKRSRNKGKGRANSDRDDSLGESRGVAWLATWWTGGDTTIGGVKRRASVGGGLNGAGVNERIMGRPGLNGAGAFSGRSLDDWMV